MAHRIHERPLLAGDEGIDKHESGDGLEIILDEVDAPLDDANIDRYIKIIRKFAQETQFIIVTHNKRTMEAADSMYGVTMAEQGISTIVNVKFNDQKIAS